MGLLDRFLAIFLLMLALPILCVAAIAIVLEDGRPVLFRQTRVGRGYRRFELWKLRTMRVRKFAGAEITSAGDSRVTRAGAVLRKYKLDELPQLFNVCRGEMSLIGPRPEVPAYVTSDQLWSEVLSVRPGITDLSTLLFRNEEHILAQAEDPEQYYRTVVLPHKLRLARQYQEIRSFLTDLRLLAVTVLCSFTPSAFREERIRRMFLKCQHP